MSDGPYDYAREIADARDASGITARRVGGQVFDEDDVPSESELE